MAIDISAVLGAYGQLGQSNAALAQRRAIAEQERRRKNSGQLRTLGTIAGAIAGAYVTRSPQGAMAGSQIGGAAGGMISSAQGNEEFPTQEVVGAGITGTMMYQDHQARQQNISRNRNYLGSLKQSQGLNNQQQQTLAQYESDPKYLDQDPQRFRQGVAQELGPVQYDHPSGAKVELASDGSWKRVQQYENVTAQYPNAEGEVLRDPVTGDLKLVRMTSQQRAAPKSVDFAKIRASVNEQLGEENKDVMGNPGRYSKVDAHQRYIAHLQDTAKNPAYSEVERDAIEAEITSTNQEIARIREQAKSTSEQGMAELREELGSMPKQARIARINGLIADLENNANDPKLRDQEDVPYLASQLQIELDRADKMPDPQPAAKTGGLGRVVNTGVEALDVAINKRLQGREDGEPIIGMTPEQRETERQDVREKLASLKDIRLNDVKGAVVTIKDDIVQRVTEGGQRIKGYFDNPKIESQYQREVAPALTSEEQKHVTPLIVALTSQTTRDEQSDQILSNAKMILERKGKGLADLSPLASDDNRLDDVFQTIAKEEGHRGNIYVDGGDGKQVVGYGTKVPYYVKMAGQLGEDRGEFDLFDKKTAEAVTKRIIQESDVELRAKMPAYRKLPHEKKKILLDMAYQMGVDGVLGFKGMIGALSKDPPDYVGAAEEMRSSRWYEQTPKRAQRRMEEMIE